MAAISGYNIYSNPFNLSQIRRFNADALPAHYLGANTDYIALNVSKEDFQKKCAPLHPCNFQGT